MSTLRIAPMELADLHEVRSLDARVYRSTWSLATWRTEVEKMPVGRVYLTATKDGDHVGHAGLMAQVDEGHVATVAVHPNAQSGGIGTALMLALAREAVGCNLRAMTLEVRVSNTKALALYAKFGFVPAGVRKAYYIDDGEDAVVMWANDITESDYLSRLRSIDEQIGSSVDYDHSLESASAAT